MSTQYKKAAAAVEEVSGTFGTLKAEDVQQAGFDAVEWASSISAAVKRLADLNIDVMRKKASEADPQKRIYGPAMSAKVLDLARRADGLRDDLIELAAKAEPLAAAQAAKQSARSTAKLPAPEEQLQAPTRQSADNGVSVQQEHPLQATGPQKTLASQTLNGGNLHQPSRTVPKPDGPSAQKHSLPKRSTPVHKYASAFHAASQKLPPPEQTSSTTRECDTEPSEAPDAATERYQKDVYRGRSGQLADNIQAVTTVRSHSAGLPVSMRSQSRPLALPVSITGQRSLQPHHVHPEQHPPPQRPPMTASQYQRSIYRGDTSRLSQAAQQQAGAASVSQAADGRLPAQSSAEESAPFNPVPVLQEPGTITETSKGPADAAQELPVAPAAGASAAVAALISTENSLPEGSSKPPPVQPEAIPGSSKAEPSQQTHQPSSSSTPAAPAVHPQPLHMPPLPPPAVHHVQTGTAEVNDILKGAMDKAVLLDFSASWCGPCRMMKPVLDRLAQRYWGVLDILAIDCEATEANRQLAQEYAIRSFPTFVLLHKGRRVDQFSGGRPEPAMAQYLDWHMSQVGAKDALLQQRLFAALSHLRQHAPPDTFQKASSTLLTILGNLVDQPEEGKFRRIRKASKAFHQSLGRLPGGCESLLAIAFTEFTEPNSEQVLIMTNIPWDLGSIRSLLAAALGKGPAPGAVTPGGPSSSTGQAAAAIQPSLQGHPVQQSAISQLLARLPRPPQGLQTGAQIGPDNMAANIARAFTAMQGQSQHNTGQTGANIETSQAAGSSPDLHDEDPELADVLKRSLEEH